MNNRELLEFAAKAAGACDGWTQADGDTCADAIRSLKGEKP